MRHLQWVDTLTASRRPSKRPSSVRLPSIDYGNSKCIRVSFRLCLRAGSRTVIHRNAAAKLDTDTGGNNEPALYSLPFFFLRKVASPCPFLSPAPPHSHASLLFVAVSSPTMILRATKIHSLEEGCSLLVGGCDPIRFILVLPIVRT